MRRNKNVIKKKGKASYNLGGFSKFPPKYCPKKVKAHGVWWVDNVLCGWHCHEECPRNKKMNSRRRANV